MCRRLSSIQVEILLWSKWQLRLISLVRRTLTIPGPIFISFPNFYSLRDHSAYLPAHLGQLQFRWNDAPLVSKAQASHSSPCQCAGNVRSAHRTPRMLNSVPPERSIVQYPGRILCLGRASGHLHWRSGWTVGVLDSGKISSDRTRLLRSFEADYSGSCFARSLCSRWKAHEVDQNGAGGGGLESFWRWWPRRREDAHKEEVQEAASNHYEF